MQKNIILLSDGTGNAASKVWRTNVWRTFESIDLSRPDQVALYADGVGTSSFKLLAVFGEMFGWGLKRNVLECYKFVSRNYQPGDRIYGFGFSRGAYTIRVAVKLILSQGLVQYNHNEADLDRYAKAAYRAFRKEHVDTVWYIKLLRKFRDVILRTPYDELNKQKLTAPDIRFLGLWDTVAAYGLPVEEMTRFYSKWIFPFAILDPKLHSNVKRACHALSIDDERTTFHPVLWTEGKVDTYFEDKPAAFTHQERISQVWFAGVADKAVSRLGDVWCLDDHRIVCGDSTSAEVVAAVLGQQKPMLMVTDPPYGVNYDPEWRNKRALSSSARTGKVRNDERADWADAWRLFPGNIAYVWHAALQTPTAAASLEREGFTIRAQIVWAKERLVIGRGDYHWQHEPCWYAVRTKGHWTGDRKQTTLWTIPSGGQDTDTVHGTQKPVECMRRPMLNNSKSGDRVYEPFLGSGTTLIAAEASRRVCLAIELDPLYVDVSVRRWQAFAGRNATLLAGGKSFDTIAEERVGGTAVPAAATRVKRKSTKGG